MAKDSWINSCEICCVAQTNLLARIHSRSLVDPWASGKEKLEDDDAQTIKRLAQFSCTRTRVTSTVCTVVDAVQTIDRLHYAVSMVGCLLVRLWV